MISDGTSYSRTSITHIEAGRQMPADENFWRRADEFLGAHGALVEQHGKTRSAELEAENTRGSEEWDRVDKRMAEITNGRLGHDYELLPVLPVGGGMWMPEHIDAGYLDTVRANIDQLVALENRFGGADLAGLSERFFQTVRQQVGAGRYERGIRKDLLALTGELAEVAGWLAYDADRQSCVRRLNQEALYFTRLAGDRSMELLSLQNASMHAGFLGRPEEARDLADMVLDGGFMLSPRLRALFLTRKARALAQSGDRESLRIFAKVRSLFERGTREDDPAWAWWIDERELAWHEAMCRQDLGDSRDAIDQFERAVQATPHDQIRSRYLHLAYLLEAQVRLRSWNSAHTTMRTIAPLATEVASTRTVVLLRKTLRRLRDPAMKPSRSLLGEASGLERTLEWAPA